MNLKALVKNVVRKSLVFKEPADLPSEVLEGYWVRKLPARFALFALVALFLAAAL